MEEAHLTQKEIDTGVSDQNGAGEGLFGRMAKHPFVTGGAVLVGAGLAYAAVKTIQSAADDVARGIHIETSIAISKSPQELYSFWRDFRNLPLFMKNLESVTESDDANSHWTVKGIGNSRIEWDAEVYNEIENELIAWRTLEAADVVNAGSVRFEKAPGGRGTYVRVTLNYNPPAGKIGATVAQLFGSEPTQIIKDDLRRLKQMLETGEIATVGGQSSGRALADQSGAPSETEDRDEAKVMSHTAPSEENEQ